MNKCASKRAEIKNFYLENWQNWMQRYEKCHIAASRPRISLLFLHETNSLGAWWTGRSIFESCLDVRADIRMSRKLPETLMSWSHASWVLIRYGLNLKTKEKSSWHCHIAFKKSNGSAGMQCHALKDGSDNRITHGFIQNMENRREIPDAESRFVSRVGKTHVTGNEIMFRLNMLFEEQDFRW